MGVMGGTVSLSTPYEEVLTPLPQNVTVLGNRGFKEVVLVK